MLNLNTNQYKWIGFALVALLCGVAIYMWGDMPLIPDEIAIRVQSGRFIQDKGLFQGLYALCETRVQSVPWIFIPSAWLLSLGDLHTNPIDLRFVTTGLLLGTLLIALYGTFKNSNSVAMAWMPAALIGISGSTLVYFRFEEFLLIQLCLCMVALYKLKMNETHTPRWEMALALVFNLLTMSYVHPQALLFIPLTAYLCYRLINGVTIEWKRLSIFAAVFGFITITTNLFFKLSCPDYKEIEAFWSEMVFDISRLFSADFFSILVAKFKLYSVSFGYNESYTIDYLPGIPKDDVAITSVLNNAIGLGLFVIIATGILIGCYLAYHFISKYALRRASSHTFNFDVAVVFALIFFPSLFYLLYDGHLYFYRSFILNFLYVVSVVIALSEFNNKKIAKLTLCIGVYLSVVVMFSIFANSVYFQKTIKTYEGPSSSLSWDWDKIPERLSRFAQSCDIDLSQGGGIISDLTYEGVKQYSRMYLITYLGLQMSLAHVKPETVIRLLKPNYVLARCTEMEGIGLGWPADKQDGKLCCTRLNK